MNVIIFILKITVFTTFPVHFTAHAGLCNPMQTGLPLAYSAYANKFNTLLNSFYASFYVSSLSI